MNLPDLLYSLTIAGLTMKLAPDDAIDIVGPIKKLSDNQRQGVIEHKAQLRKLLELQTECLTNKEELAEREAIAFADTEVGRKQAIKVGAEFVLMAAQDHHTCLWNRIGEIDDVGDLFAFAERFEKDLMTYGVFRPIAEDIRELIANRRALLRKPKPRGSWPHLSCTSGPYRTAEFRRQAEDRRADNEGRARDYSEEEMHRRYLGHIGYPDDSELASGQAGPRSCDTGQSERPNSRQVDGNPKPPYTEEANGPGASTPEPF